MIVYKAENKINGKVYIGITGKSLHKRIISHKSRAKFGNNYFHNAIRKYGVDKFEWSVLCECSNRQELNKMERVYISNYRGSFELYNMTSGGDGGDTLSNHPNKKEICKIISERLAGHTTWNKGKTKYNDDRVKKISESNKGKVSTFKGRTHTEESKRKLREKRKLQIMKSPSIETRQKLRESNIGKDHGMKGENNSFYGKKHSETTLIKLRKPKSEDHKQKLRKPKSEEARRHLSDARKKYLERIKNKGE
jgi:group I intron endonuclease